MKIGYWNGGQNLNKLALKPVYALLNIKEVRVSMWLQLKPLALR